MPAPPDPDIHVSVTVTHRPDYSDAVKHAFQYHISLENRSDQTWQLLARHWDIQDGSGRTVTVDGEGVVGEQPILAPGARFSYDSFVTVEVLPGHMGGYYVMQDAWGEQVRVPIAPFYLNLGERVLN